MTRHFRTDSTSLVNGWSGSLSVHLHEIPRLQRCLPCNASCHGGLLFKKKTRDPNNIHSTVVFDNNNKIEKKTNSSSWWSPKNKTKMAPHLHTHLHNGENKNVLAVDKKKVKTKEKKQHVEPIFFWLKFTFRPYFPHQSTQKKEENASIMPSSVANEALHSRNPSSYDRIERLYLSLLCSFNKHQ